MSVLGRLRKSKNDQKQHVSEEGCYFGHLNLLHCNLFRGIFLCEIVTTVSEVILKIEFTLVFTNN